MVSGSYPPVACGIGDYTRCLVKELLQKGIDVKVTTTVCQERERMPEICLQLENWKLGSWAKAIGWIAGQSFDVVHIQYPGKAYGYLPDLAWLTRMLKKLLPNLPIVVTLHEFRVTHPLRKLSVAMIASFADALLVTARSEKSLFDRWLPWLRRKIVVIPVAPAIPVLPLRAEDRSSLRRRYGFDEASLIVAYFGFVQPNKGIEELLQAFRLVRQRHSRSRLLMICHLEPQANPYHARLHRLTTSLGLSSSIAWTGFLGADEVSRHLSIADVAVFPFVDGVTMRRTSFMAAMSHGLPTVTTIKDASLQELQLVEGRNVLLTPAPANPARLAEKVNALLESERLRMSLRAGALRWAESLRWDRIAERTTEVYHSLVR